MASAPSLDAAISRIGTGRFHYKLLALCGWANASDAIEMLAVRPLLSGCAARARVYVCLSVCAHYLEPNV